MIQLMHKIKDLDGEQYLLVGDVADALKVSVKQVYVSYTNTYLAVECPAEVFRLLDATEGRLLLPLAITRIVVERILRGMQDN